MEKSKVYFSKHITSQRLVDMFEVLEKELDGNIGIKVHTGEKGNQNYLKPIFYKDIIDYVGGTIIECNTAYDGERNTTEKHIKLVNDHGWNKLYNVDIMDAEEEIEIPIVGGKHLKTNVVGKNFEKYDSLLVLSHFKGHPMGGFGGALKNISIGIASSNGKALIHGVGDPSKIWTADHDSFLECMAEAAKSVVDSKNKKIAYVNVMANMSVDCDCCSVAEDPCMEDIGILSSTDPVALDKACVDLVYKSKDKGKDHLIERIESRNGIHTINVANDLGVGNKDYELIIIDEEE